MIFSGSLCSLSWKNIQLHNDLPFLPEIVKIEKSKDVVASLYDKTE